VNSCSPASQRISRDCPAQWRNSSDNWPAASASTRRNPDQSNTQGSGSCRVTDRSRATASVSINSGQTQPTSPATRAADGRSSAAASATSFGSENHCGDDTPNWWT
jgi:hypothetical protein